MNNWVQAPSTAQALVLRSQIVLAAAAGRANQQIAWDLKIPQCELNGANPFDLPRSKKTF